MRKVAIWGVALVCVALILATGGIEAEKKPKVVEVTGTVDVGNLPATQNVGGTVAVSNLPTVQTVTGTVDVGNLPFDTEGNIRVSGVVGSESSFALFQIPDLPISHGSDSLSDPISIAGWRNVSLIGVLKDAIVVPGSGGSVALSIRMEQGVNPFFEPGPSASWFSTSLQPTRITTSDVIAPGMQIRGLAVGGTASGSGIAEVWVYLSN